jgi:drug/metabolite transporter (DMT)-like permease
MIKSSTPVWVLLFSFLFGFEKPKLNLILIISVIVFGVWLTIDGQPKFDFQGFILVLIAAIASGLRWNMTQYLMKRRKRNDEQQQQNSPISTMYHTSPVMFITMLLLSLFIEKPFQQQQQVAAGMDNSWFDSFIWRSIISLVIMAIGGILGKNFISFYEYIFYALLTLNYI